MLEAPPPGHMIAVAQAPNAAAPRLDARRQLEAGICNAPIETTQTYSASTEEAFDNTLNVSLPHPPPPIQPIHLIHPIHPIHPIHLFNPSAHYSPFYFSYLFTSNDVFFASHKHQKILPSILTFIYILHFVIFQKQNFCFVISIYKFSFNIMKSEETFLMKSINFNKYFLEFFNSL